MGSQKPKTISIDPGVNHCGIAVFEEKTLKYAKLIENDSMITKAIVAEEKDSPIGAIEVPQVYRVSKGDPNDLINVALAAGAHSASFETVKFYRPREWKGNVPKDVMCRRILGRLTEEEKTRIEYCKQKSLHHNILDAIGIGLFHIGRL